MFSLDWPFVNAIFGTYLLTGSLGWAIVAVTIGIRLLLVPLVLPSLKAATKMRELQPKIKKLQEKYGSDKQALAQAQMSLYKEEKVNPLGGCLPQLLQIVVLIVFFSAFNLVTGFSEGKIKREEFNKHLMPALRVDQDFKFNPYFLGNDLRETPSKIVNKGDVGQMVIPLLMLLGSGGLQFLTSKAMLGKPAEKKEGGEKKSESSDKPKSAEEEMAAAMRTQSLYVMPVMTIIIGWGLSLGILWYWFVNSLFMWGQQLVVDAGQRKKAV